MKWWKFKLSSKAEIFIWKIFYLLLKEYTQAPDCIAPNTSPADSDQR